MLSPNDILAVSEGGEMIASELHDEIIKRIVQRITKRLDSGDDYTLTAYDKWQIEVLQDAGYLREDIEKAIAGKTGLMQKEIAEAMDDAGVKSAGYGDKVYRAAGLNPGDITGSPYWQRLMQRNYKATYGEWVNFTRTTADACQQSFIKACDKAYTLVSSGAMGYTQAYMEAINDIVNTGTRVTYPSGHSDTIETATLRCIRTGVSQATAQIATARMDEMDWDIVLVSSHLGARVTGNQDYTDHAWWQGKFYSRSGKDKRFKPFSVCGEGLVQGICGANCRHSFDAGDGEFNPYEKYDSEENQKAYEMQQRQRVLERRIRESKHKVLGWDETRKNATTAEAKDAAEAEYQRQAALLQKRSNAYTDFCSENGLKKLEDRIAIAKWDRKQAAQARGAAKRNEKAKEEKPKDYQKQTAATRNSITEQQKSVANSGRSSTIITDRSATKASQWENGLPPRGQVTVEISEDDLYQWVANDLGIAESEATEYVEAVMAFTDAGSAIYSEIRRYQRGEPLQFLTDAEAKKMSGDIETYIKKAPRWNGGVTFRGSTVSDEELATYKPGQPFAAGGTSSWSGTQKIAKDFAERNATPERPNPVIYHCDTQSKGTGIRHISVFGHEDEVLCSKESSWEIVRTEMDSDFITHI